MPSSPLSPPLVSASPPAGSALRASRWGIAQAGAANLWWGFIPVYFKALSSVSSTEILAHRIVWSFALLALVEWRRLGSLGASWRMVRSRRRATVGLLATSSLIGANWLIFVIAIHAGKTIEASVGYFISPLVTAAIGMILLGERSTKAQLLGMSVVLVGVASYVYAAGGVPWVALGLAGTFAAYGYIRKMLGLSPLTGLLWETAFMLPPAVAWLAWMAWAGPESSFGALSFWNAGPWITFLLLLAGGLTAGPLLLYAAALQRIDLRFVGMLQYISPTCQFLLGWLAFHEDFDSARALSLVVIWCGLAFIAVWGILRPVRR